MARPREYKPRNGTTVRFDPEIDAALVKAAAERDLSVNRLVTEAVKEFLDRLLPVDEWLTRPAPTEPLQPGVPTLDLTETARL